MLNRLRRFRVEHKSQAKIATFTRDGWRKLLQRFTVVNLYSKLENRTNLSKVGLYCFKFVILPQKALRWFEKVQNCVVQQLYNYKLYGFCRTLYVAIIQDFLLNQVVCTNQEKEIKVPKCFIHIWHFLYTTGIKVSLFLFSTYKSTFHGHHFFSNSTC